MTSAAKRRVDLAQERVHDAQGKLDVANKELEESIPNGDLGRIQCAHAITQRAEKTVAEAAAELEVAAELLTEEIDAPASPADSSGAGVRSLIDSLRSARKLRA